MGISSAPVIIELLDGQAGGLHHNLGERNCRLRPRRKINLWTASFHTGADVNVQHPTRNRHNNSRRPLHLEELTRGTMLNPPHAGADQRGEVMRHVFRTARLSIRSEWLNPGGTSCSVSPMRASDAAGGCV